MDDDALIRALQRRVADHPRPDSVASTLATYGTKWAPQAIAALEARRAHPVATNDDVDATERALDAPLPQLLRRVFLEVANGGFGPGFGVLGANNGYRDADYGTLVDAYRSFATSDRWPRGLLILVKRGSGLFAALSTLEFAGKIAVNDLSGALTVTDLTLAEFLSVWADGGNVWDSTHEDAGVIEREGINPFTREHQVFRRTVQRARGRPWPGYAPEE